MLKTIKVKKQLRLDELIKYVWDNVKGSCKFESTNGECIAEFDTFGKIQIIMRHFNYLHPSMVFTVEVEEEIKADTPFEDIVILHINGISHLGRGGYHSIRSIRRDYPTVAEIHTLMNGKLQLIWEAE